MKIAIKVETPLGTIFGDVGEEVSPAFLEKLLDMFKDISNFDYLTVTAGGNDVFIPKGLLHQSYITIVKNPDWEIGGV